MIMTSMLGHMLVNNGWITDEWLFSCNSLVNYGWIMDKWLSGNSLVSITRATTCPMADTIAGYMANRITSRSIRKVHLCIGSSDWLLRDLPSHGGVIGFGGASSFYWPQNPPLCYGQCSVSLRVQFWSVCWFVGLLVKSWSSAWLPAESVKRLVTGTLCRHILTRLTFPVRGDSSPTL